MKNISKLKIRLAAIVLAAAGTFSLAGCKEQVELAPDEEYDIVDTSNDGQSLSAGLKQVLEVPGQNFKLITEYSCDNDSKRQWRITSDKFLYLKVHTEGLSDDTIVYIDNVHIDTSIKSKYAVVDGIKQDSMDDHTQSSKLIGFPISDNTIYYGVNAIEGCNEDFIKGTFHGYNGYSNGTIEEKRYTESDYMDLGVYANKIVIVYDLLVKGPKDNDFINISVPTDFLVPVTETKIQYGEKKY